MIQFACEKTRWASAHVDHGETRIICYGLLAGRVVVVGYTPRGADRHVFSMRKANEREKARIAPLLGVTPVDEKSPELIRSLQIESLAGKKLDYN